MACNKADGCQLISGGHVLITEIAVMKAEVETEQFAYLYETNEIPRKKKMVIKERCCRNL